MLKFLDEGAGVNDFFLRMDLRTLLGWDRESLEG